MYDLNLLVSGRSSLWNSRAIRFCIPQNENDVAPFPAEQVDFSLSSCAEFGTLLRGDKSSSSSPEAEGTKPVGRRKSTAAVDKYDFDNQDDQGNESSNDESGSNDNDAGSVKKSSHDGENSLNSDDQESVHSSTKLTATPTTTAPRQPKQQRQRAGTKSHANEERKVGHYKKRKN